MWRRFNAIEISLLLVIVLGLFCTSLCQFNTHQNITLTIPSVSPFRLFLKPGDEVIASISNTNTKFFIAFLSDDRSILLTQQGYCFLPQSCNLTFKSKWRVNGWLLIQIYYSHEYDYEIKQNSNVLKSQHIYSLLQAETFIYPYFLQAQNYTISLYYESKLTDNLIFIMFETEYTIKANETRDITVSLTETQPWFSLYFQLLDMDLQMLTQSFNIQLTVTLPNVMLKNCNGNNHFNQRLKACGQLVETQSDTLIIDRYGIFSHFTIHRRETVTIRMTLVELVHFVDEFNPHLITSFLIHSADPRVFKDKPAKWILENYQTQYQQCKVVGTQCSLSFTIDPGRYCFLPFLPQRMPQVQFVYLFQRLDDRGKLMQSYYSVFPAQYQDKLQQNSFLNFDGMMFQLASTSEQLIKLQMRSDHELVMTAYNIHRRKQNEGDDKVVFQLVQLGLENSFSSNLNVVTILTQLTPFQPHMVYIKFHSREFFLDYMELGTDKYDIYSTDPFLQNTTIHLKLINGQFPHKKIKEKLLQDDDDYIEEKQTETEQEQEKEDNLNDKEQIENIDNLSSTMMIILIVLVVIILVLTVLLGVLLMKHNKNKKAFTELDSKTLLSDNNIIATDQLNAEINSTQGIIYTETKNKSKLENQKIKKSAKDQKISHIQEEPKFISNQNTSSRKEGNNSQHQVAIQMNSVNIISNQ